MDLKELGEFGLIERIKEALGGPMPDGVLGIGDDCAVLPQAGGMETLVSTDMLLEGSHFLRGDIPARLLGWKSAAVNFSDIAAMGGRPVGSFLSLGLPAGLDSDWMDAFLAGYKECSQYCGAPLLGGDTTTSQDGIAINVTVIGQCQRGRSRKRSSAVPGDLICVTGPLGDSAAGLKLILERHALSERHARLDRASQMAGQAGHDAEAGQDAEALVERHYRPVPRVSEGQALAATPGVHAMMDISDGVASDLRHILKASDVGATVRTKDVPLSAELRQVCAQQGWDAVTLALTGGEDYELLFTMAPGTEPSVPYYVIGRITEQKTLVWEGSSQDFMGFRHF
ncbi:MAG: thiamine-phosphate kinase [Bacteroidales bacterium]|nr:thiamine-phosphate kinase [Bacteroidales bacterium]